MTFSRKKSLLARVRISSIFNFDFFHSLAEFGGAGREDYCSASPFSQLLFLDAWALDVDAFLLPDTSVFIRIRSGALGWRLQQ
jgi:hypothetical protein